MRQKSHPRGTKTPKAPNLRHSANKDGGIGGRMKKGQETNKGIATFRDKEAYQWELGLEQERIGRKKTLDSLKEEEEREVLEKAGQEICFEHEKEVVRTISPAVTFTVLAAGSSAIFYQGSTTSLKN